MGNTETINTYLLDSPDVVVPMNREEFYKEQIEIYKKTGKPTRAVELIDIFIFNSHGELLIQKRSFEKEHNPGLLDKSIGGHIRYGDTPDYTVMVETIQELQTPSIVLKGGIAFQKTFTLLSDYLETIAIIQHENVGIHLIEKVFKGEKIVIANKIHLYYGVYDGRIRPVDREAKGVLFYSLPDLEKEIKQLPDAFTGDIKFLLEEYRPSMEKFVADFTKK